MGLALVLAVDAVVVGVEESVPTIERECTRRREFGRIDEFGVERLHGVDSDLGERRHTVPLHEGILQVGVSASPAGGANVSVPEIDWAGGRRDSMVNRTHETAVVEGHRLHYIAAGDRDAPTLLLLHGGIIDAAHVTWGAVIEPLARDYRVITLDLLGYGRSAKPDVTYALSTHVDIVESFAETVGLDSPAIAGISMGGGVALGLALQSPGLVDRLVSIDSYGLGRELANGRLTYVLAQTQVQNRVAVALMRRSRGFTKVSLGNIVHDTDTLSPDAVDAVWEETKRPGVGKAFRRFRAAEVTSDGYRTDFSGRLSELAVPTLLLHGAHDEVFPHRWSERAAARIPDSEFRLLENCAHWAPRERPDTVVDLISGFVPR